MEQEAGQAEAAGPHAPEVGVEKERREEQRPRLVGRVAVGQGLAEWCAGVHHPVLLDAAVLIEGEGGVDRREADDERHEEKQREGEAGIEAVAVQRGSGRIWGTFFMYSAYP